MPNESNWDEELNRQTTTTNNDKQLTGIMIFSRMPSINISVKV